MIQRNFFSLYLHSYLKHTFLYKHVFRYGIEAVEIVTQPLAVPNVPICIQFQAAV